MALTSTNIHFIIHNLQHNNYITVYMLQFIIGIWWKIFKSLQLNACQKQPYGLENSV